jgi:hypothetical protein
MRIFKKSRCRPMSEAMAYARCHGARGSEIVRVTRVAPVELPPVTGEAVRAAFEARLIARFSDR